MPFTPPKLITPSAPLANRLEPRCRCQHSEHLNSVGNDGARSDQAELGDGQDLFKAHRHQEARLLQQQRCFSSRPSNLRLRNLASSLPSELITSILEFAAATTTENPAKLRLLCLSKYYHERLSPLLYGTIALCSSTTIHAFAALVKSDAKLARYVCRLWIGPESSSSDLISALSPPSYHEAAYITDMRERVHTSVRTILRSCRKLQDVALAGELLSLHAAHTYGSACQPVRLTSVNPHSFVGAFRLPSSARYGC